MSELTNSSQPRRQRRARFTAPAHMRQGLVSAHVSKELRKSLGTTRRSLPVRKGDKVKVLRGDAKGKVGKITRVDLGSLKVFMEGVTSKKAKGGEVPAPVDPSNLMIIEAVTADRLRREILGMKGSPKAEAKSAPAPKTEHMIAPKTEHTMKTEAKPAGAGHAPKV